MKKQMFSKKDLRSTYKGNNLLTTALEVHEYCVGSLDCAEEYVIDNINVLKLALEVWEEPSSAFDLDVKSLIESAITEYEREKNV